MNPGLCECRAHTLAHHWTIVSGGIKMVGTVARPAWKSGNLALVPVLP